MDQDFSSIVAHPESDIKLVMKLLNSSEIGIVVIADNEEKVLGTITDGDVRRGILNNLDTNSLAGQFMNRNFIYVNEDSSDQEVEAKFQQHPIEQVIVLDKTGKFKNLIFKNVPKFQIKSKAFILAGGLGSRLGDFTKDTPKPMLDVHGKPILEWIIKSVVEAGISEIYLSVNYKYEQIQNYFLDGADYNCQIEYVVEKERLGTGGSLSLISAQSDPLLVLNGDLLTTLNYSNLLSYHKKNNSDITICSRKYVHQIPFGVINSSNNEIISLKEKPSHESMINAGVYVINPTIIDMLAKNTYMDITEIIQVAINKQFRVINFPLHESWIDIGRPEELQKARSNDIYLKEVE